MLLPKIIYDASSSETTLNFSYPPVQKPGTAELESDREDTLTLTGARQSISIRTDEFFTLQMDYVPQDDLPDWSDFLDYALTGGTFDYYPDATDVDFTTYTLEDTAFSPKLNFRGYAKFTLRFRKYIA